MALKPLLKSKVDELFLRWLSEPDTQQLLKTNLRQIIKGEPVTVAPPSAANAIRTTKPASPRVRPVSPSTPPCSPSVNSPRSPRRTHTNRSFGRGLGSSSGSKLIKEPDEKLPQRNDPEKAGTGEFRGTPDGAGLGAGDISIKDARTLQDDLQKEMVKKDQEKSKRKELIRKDGVAQKGSSDSKTVVSNSVTSGSEPAKNNKAVPGSATIANKKLGHVDFENNKQRPSSRTGSEPEQNSVSVKKPADHVPSPSTVGDIAGIAKNIPQFYFPNGEVQMSSKELDATAQKIRDAINKLEGSRVSRQNIGTVMKAASLPLYWKYPFFLYAGGEKTGFLTLQNFMAAWKRLVTTFNDDASRFLQLLAKPGKRHLEHDDFLPLVHDIVDTHPGLTFLQDAPEFHSRYEQTVISRIYFCVNRSWTGRITVNELRRSKLLQTLRLLEDEEDINAITDFFSYEHFYVIYCKFWELDKDHDLFISPEDLRRHNDHAISTRMIDRIFSLTRELVDGKMSYRDFVWFLIAEEDKKNPTSMEYWFRCMDIDGDGYISMYEMNYFYEEQVQKMEALGIETLPFEDCLCQMLDMIGPQQEGKVALRDIKACKLSYIFFDTFFNLEKYLEHEQKDPFANDRDGEEAEMSDWERYASEEYEMLVAEEGANELQSEEIQYEDDFDPEDEEEDELLQIALANQDNGKKDVPKVLSSVNRDKTSKTGSVLDDDDDIDISKGKVNRLGMGF